MAPKVSSKHKGKEAIREDSPPRYDHSSYISQEAFDRYSTVTISYGRIVNFEHLGLMRVNQMMRRMQWLTFARLSYPSYPNLIRRFYANLSKPNKDCLDLICTVKDVNIELDPSTMCRILGVNNDGDEIYDSNNCPILPNFNAQATLKRLYKLDSWHPKPKSENLTLQSRLPLIFVQHNILSQGGHRSEPSYMDLWLRDSILCGRKVNLGFLVIQHMTNILASAHSVLPYDMFLTTIFQHFEIDLDGETNIHICKSSDAIDHNSIS